MALTRIKTWAREALTFDDLNSEFNNIVNYWNSFGVTNPAGDDFDMGGYYLLNAKFRRLMRIRNRQEFSTTQEAIDDLANDSDGANYQGGIVYFPPDIYTESAVTTVPSNVYLVGAGWGKSIIRKNYDDDTGAYLFYFNGVDNCGITGLTIDGQGSANVASGATGVHCIGIVGGCTDIFVEKNEISDWGNAADLIALANDGVYIAGNSSRIWVRGNRFGNIQRNAVAAVQAVGVVVSDNHIKNCGHCCIDFEPNTGLQVTDFRIANNYCEEAPNLMIVFKNTATDHNNLVRGTVTGNVLTAPDTGGRMLVMGSTNEVTFVGNTLRAGDDIAIDLKDCRYTSIVGNTIDQVAVGISVGAQQSEASDVTQDVVVSGNTVRATTLDGIQVAQGSGATNDIVVDSNITRNCGTDGTHGAIRIQDVDRVTITNNTMRGNASNTSYGVWFSSANPADDVVLVGNRTTAHVTAGLRIDFMPTNLTIGHNRFTEDE